MVELRRRAGMRGRLSAPAVRARLEEPIVRVKVAFVMIGLAEATVVPFLPLFLLDRGFSATAIGVVLALASLASFVAGPIWGYLLDGRARPERGLVASGLAAAGIALVFLVPERRVLIAVATILLWTARLCFTSLLDAVALQRLGSARRTEYGRVRLWMSAGWALAVVAWGAALESGGLRLMPLLYAPAITLVAVWARVALASGAPERTAARRATRRPRRLPRVPGALLGFLVSTLLLSASFSASQSFLALRIAGLGGGALLVGVAASLQAVTEIPPMASIARLTRTFTHRSLFVIGCAIYAAVFLAWAIVTDPLAIALIRLVIGVGFALTYVGSVVLADDLVPARLRTTGQALTKAVSFGLAPIVGTLGGGLLYGLVGPRSMFLAAAATAALAALVARVAIDERTAVEPALEPGQPT